MGKTLTAFPVSPVTGIYFARRREFHLLGREFIRNVPLLRTRKPKERRAWRS
jgi:hypothetical protein